MVTEVWLDHVDDSSDAIILTGEDAERFRVPCRGEKVGYRQIEGQERSYYLDFVVDVRTFFFRIPEDDEFNERWKQEIHVMTSENP
jgi:hypothetical protein